MNRIRPYCPIGRGLGHRSGSVSSAHDAAVTSVTASLVPLHIASYAEGLSATCVWASERLLAGVGVTVNLQARWS